MTNTLKLIQDMNLGYLEMIRKTSIHDADLAARVFGLSENLISIIAKLDDNEIAVIAKQNMMLCSFKFNDEMLFNMISSYKIPAQARLSLSPA